MKLFDRARGLLFDPDNEWLEIEREPHGLRELFLRYVAVLALIPALCGFIGMSLIGIPVSAGTFRVPLLTGLVNALMSYAFSFLLVYAMAFVIDLLAPRFRGERNFTNAMKLSVYSFTPSWLAGVFLLIPHLRFLGILGLYGLYLLWTGLPPLMRCPRDRSFLFALSVVICAIAVIVALATVQGAFVSLLW